MIEPDWSARLAACLDDPAQVEILRPALEEYASTTRRALRLVEALLGVGDRQPDLLREHEQLIVDHHEALARAQTLEEGLNTANAWIAVLQTRLADHEDDATDTYATVGLRDTAHDVVVAAARRALLAHYHPDRAGEGDKARMSSRFAAASAAFDKIAEARRC